MPRGSAIILIGFMGTGKSSVGVELGRRGLRPLFDTDKMIATKLKMPITEIFAQLGSEAFRDEETEALRAIPPTARLVVTGGGVIVRSENIALMQQLGTIVWLQADEETIFRRVSHRDDRPLLKNADPRERIAQLLQAREPLYRACADLQIDTTARKPAQIAEELLGLFSSPKND